MSHQGADFSNFKTRFSELAADLRACAEGLEHPWTKQQVRDMAALCDHAAVSLGVAEANRAVSEEFPLAEKVVKRDSK